MQLLASGNWGEAEGHGVYLDESVGNGRRALVLPLQLSLFLSLSPSRSSNYSDQASSRQWRTSHDLKPTRSSTSYNLSFLFFCDAMLMPSPDLFGSNFPSLADVPDKHIFLGRPRFDSTSTLRRLWCL